MTMYTHRRLVALFSSCVVLLGGCQKHSTNLHHDPPAHVEHVNGEDVARVTLTAQAVERIDLQTGRVVEEPTGAAKTVPYSALLYEANGDTWVYTSPQPRTFVRHEVDVDRIEGDQVFLAAGPAVGTVIATQGVAELYGTEFEVGH